jgi:hypothetical protein
VLYDVSHYVGQLPVMSRTRYYLRILFAVFCLAIVIVTAMLYIVSYRVHEAKNIIRNLDKEVSIGHQILVEVRTKLKLLTDQLEQVLLQRSPTEHWTDRENHEESIAPPHDQTGYYSNDTQSPGGSTSRIQAASLSYVTDALQLVDQDNEELIQHIRDHWIIPPSTEYLDIDDPSVVHHAQVN